MASRQIDGAPRQLSPDSFADLVKPWLKQLANHARRILRSDDLAWDAVQEALLTLWLEPEVPPNPHAWLIRTVVNRSLHLSRSRARRWKHEDRARLSCEEASDRDDPARKLQHDDTAKHVREAFTKIAPEQCEILILRAVNEMSYESISDAMQIPVGTVRSRLNRSRKAVRAILRLSDPNEDD